MLNRNNFNSQDGKKKWSNLPDGEYVATVDQIKGEITAEKDKNHKITIVLKVIEGEKKNRLVFKNYSFPECDEDSSRWDWLNKSLEFCGNDFALLGNKKELSESAKTPTDIVEELTAMGQDLSGVNVVVNLVTKKANNGKEYQNCFINELYDGEVAESNDDFGPEPNFDKDDEIPF